MPSLLMAEPRPLRVAIVGSGPAGMYAAGHLLEGPAGTFADGRLSRRVQSPIEVDVIDRLATPWGLIRSGVAPDHPDKKRMALVYDAIARRPGFRFIGNVEIGAAVTHADLRQWYDAVIYAVGADGERSLGIPGESLPGCSPARRFVGWYNGHPDFSGERFDFETPRAIIIGNGNVSLDVARILLKPVDELRQTDIAQHALDALARSRIREVVILGRRGPQDAACNFPELEELGELHDTAVSVDDPAALQAALAGGAPSRVVKTLQRLCARQESASRRIVFRFNSTPVAVLGNGRAEGLLVSATGDAAQQQSLSSALILAAVGYKGRPIAGLPFDDSRGVIPNRDGRVLDGERIEPRVYVTGWVKRGPKGIIGTNKKCARDTVAAVLDDLGGTRRPDTLDHAAVLQACRLKGARPSSFEGWLQIDRAERRAGSQADRPRIKLTTHGELETLATQARF